MLFSAYMFSLEREKIIAWYEKCIPGFVKHKIDVFMKNSVGVLVSYCFAQLKIMVVIIAILWIGFFVGGIGHSVKMCIRDSHMGSTFPVGSKRMDTKI